MTFQNPAPGSPHRRAVSAAAEETLQAARQAMAAARQAHQPMIPPAPIAEGDPFVPVTEPVADPIETTELPPADISGNVAAQLPRRTVPELYESVRQAERELASAVAGYGAIQLYVAALTAGRSTMPLPLFRWTTRLENRAVEVVSDLSLLSPQQQLQSMQPWLELHRLQMEQAVGKLTVASRDLQEILYHARRQESR